MMNKYYNIEVVFCLDWSILSVQVENPGIYDQSIRTPELLIGNRFSFREKTPSLLMRIPLG